MGEVLFEDLAGGTYKCRITAGNHQEYGGRVWIKPGITVTKDVFLAYNLVTVEWEVNEITIEDKYEIVLTATYETDVPAAVVVAEPASVTLPDMKAGDVYHGEFVLTNHGLIRADGLNFSLPESDAHFRYELPENLPDFLEAKGRMKIPYRVTCLKALDQEEETGTGGGCYSYMECITTGYYYICSNGMTFGGASTRHCVTKSYGDCSGEGGGGVGGHWGYTFSGGGEGDTSGRTISPRPVDTPLESTQNKCILPPPCPYDDDPCREKDSEKNNSQEVGSWVNTPTGRYWDSSVDLTVDSVGDRSI